MLGCCLDNVRRLRPVIHNITNFVTANDVANAILACGGSPIMADDPREMADITSICSGLTINIGTINEKTEKSMFLAGKISNELGHIIVLDPVGAGASELRTDISKKILEEIHVDVIRGNLSEVMAIFSEDQKTNGVDANDADTINESTVNNIADLAKNFSKRFGGMLAITGEIDVVADKNQCYAIRNGRQEMSKVTGTGCMLSGIMAAFLAANTENKITAAAAATCMMGIAGEIGTGRMKNLDGNSVLRSYIIDALYNMDGESLDKMAKYEIL